MIAFNWGVLLGSLRDFLRDFTRTANQPCREQTRLISQSQDSPLSRGEAAGLRIHLLYCRGCKRFRQQVLRLRDIAASMGRAEGATDGMPADVRERLDARLASERPPVDR